MIAILFCSVLGYAQKLTPKHAPKPTRPEISAAFSKAAVKAQLTIQRSADNKLVDAAMVDMEAEASDQAEKEIAFHVGFIEFDHYRKEATGESACIIAWLPRLRALSAGTPNECYDLWASRR